MLSINTAFERTILNCFDLAERTPRAGACTALDIFKEWEYSAGKLGGSASSSGSKSGTSNRSKLFVKIVDLLEYERTVSNRDRKELEREMKALLHTLSSSREAFGNRATWSTSNEKNFQNAAEHWVWKKTADANNLSEMLVYAAWFELIDSVKSDRYTNCLLGGKSTIPTYIDRDMARYAEIKWIACEDKYFLVWLNFARQATIAKGCNLVFTDGPVYRLPTSEGEKAVKLGKAWGIGPINVTEEERN